ncbi:uncharacterized protein LOC133734973 [Rosa rugosa]|uniref:uncharacterized protein LOC133734973 n=1 Tax=Rosa rugosa TaxID=74645 RepID=UPI002B4158D1|nr:uncharacterized protein LOC133734973 [Rosa rugosa]
MQWNDSAAEEAFNCAEKRFLDKIDGLPCNIPLPDPDAYIHKIDWSSSRTSTGPELVTDNQETRGKDEGEVVIDDVESLSDQSSWGPGWLPGAWDESEEESEEDANSSVDNEENLDHKEAADVVGFDNSIGNNRDKNKMVQELMMGLILESPL